MFRALAGDRQQRQRWSRRAPMRFRLLFITGDIGVYAFNAMSAAAKVRSPSKNIPRQVVYYLIAGFFITMATAWMGLYTADLSMPNTVPGTMRQTDGSVGQLRTKETIFAERCVLLHDRDRAGVFVNRRFSDLVDSWWKGRKEANWQSTNNFPPEHFSFLARTQILYDELSFVFTAPIVQSGGRPLMPPPVTPPAWLEPATGHDDAAGAYWLLQIDDRAGWPFRALQCRTVLAPISRNSPFHMEKLRWGIPLSDPAEIWTHRSSNSTVGTAISEWRLLPIRPIWPAFAGNVLIWSCALFAVVWFVRYPARRRRKRIGKCRKCGYDLRGIESLRCPECGTGIIKTKRAQTSPQRRR